MQPRPSEHSPEVLRGESVVFTGRLTSLSRIDAHKLVARLGGTPLDEVNARTTILVVGEASSSGTTAECEKDKTRKIRRAEAINASSPGRVKVLTEDQFCKLAGLRSPAELRQQWRTLRDVLAMYPNLREDHLRYLQKWNLVRPALRTHAETYFSFPDLAVFRQANAELERGIRFPALLRSLVSSRLGQLSLDFHSDAAPAKVISLIQTVAARQHRPLVDTAVAEEYFLLGSTLDDGDPANQDAACAAYRRAIEADPCLVPALVNLANIHYARGELVEAEALYQRAIALEWDVFEAHFNLGNVHHDLGRLDEARACYEQAVHLNEGYPEAHFYLAVTLEKLGKSDQAKPHWRRYRDLAPEGEWVDLAREFGE
ncbi:MAG: tetratricopeptide repeat protein [Acidobacteria bacterium]|nr:MAG: tetratricopeptide repeat protein [Acidobacteriota bacterium]